MILTADMPEEPEMTTDWKAYAEAAGESRQLMLQPRTRRREALEELAAAHHLQWRSTCSFRQRLWGGFSPPASPYGLIFNVASAPRQRAAA